MGLWRARPVLLDLPTPIQPMRVGVEQEFRVWNHDAMLDFRTVIGSITSTLPRLNPGDPRARHLPSGCALTADGWEAELASPPLALDRVAEVDALLAQERTELRDRLFETGASTGLAGFSTHVNVSVPDDHVLSIGRRFARSCAPALASLTEPAESSGVFVRPRRGRLEYGGEYVDGERLTASLVLICSCIIGLTQGTEPAVEPATLVPSREKFGWFLEPESRPSAFDSVWAWARAYARLADLDEAVVDRVSMQAAHDPTTVAFTDRPVSASSEPKAIHSRVRHVDGLGAVSVETEWLTWDYAVWRLSSPHETRQAVLPASVEVDFLHRLDSGELDVTIRASFAQRRPAQLLVNADITEAALWHTIRPGALVPAERLSDGSSPRISRRRARRSLP